MATATGTHVPGIGHLSKKEMTIGAVAVGGVVVIGLYRSHKNSQAKAAAAASSTTSGTTASNLDPATGLPSGSPEDIAALQGQSQYANTTAYGYASGGYSTNTTGTLQGFTSNSQWAQAAQEYLTNYTAGSADPSTIAAALGAYITGSYVTAAQHTIIEQAIAFEGAPPQSGTNGYPPSINTTPPSTGTGTGTGTGTTNTTKVPANGTLLLIPYNVRAGMNIPQIANQFGLSVPHLLQYNPGKVNPSPIGTSIIVPYEVKTGMSLTSIAQAFGISVDHLLQYLPASA
jgi:LysM repeat protein